MDRTKGILFAREEWNPSFFSLRDRWRNKRDENSFRTPLGRLYSFLFLKIRFVLFIFFFTMGKGVTLSTIHLFVTNYSDQFDLKLTELRKLAKNEPDSALKPIWYYF